MIRNNLREWRLLSNFESFEEIISFAIEKEKEAVAFYDSASRQEPYSGARKTFEAFAGAEGKHQVLLEGILKGERKLADYKFEWIPHMKRSDFQVDLK